MDRSIEQALGSLVPTFNTSPPEQVLRLAASLLAQSRTRAGNLKPDEEIARLYACTHLACERLKNTLNIPKIVPRPPCPPRIYTKLFKYFDQLLDVRTPSRRTQAGQPRSTREPSPSLAAAKRKRASNDVSQARPSPKQPRLSRNQLKEPASVPGWVQPFIGRLCTDMVDPTVVPHVTAGVKAVLTHSPPHLPTMSHLPAEPKRDKAAALVIAIVFCVQARLFGGEATVKTISTSRKAAVELANHAEHNADGQEDITEGDVDKWMEELYSRGWLKMPWYKDIETEYTSRSSSTGGQEGGGASSPYDERRHSDEEDVGEGEEAEDDEEEEDDESRPASRKIRKAAPGIPQTWRKEVVEPGLNTMMQPKLDFLGPEKKAEYRAWERRMLKRIDELERAQGG